MHGQNATYPTILYNSGGSCHLHVPYRTFLDHPTQSCGGFCFKTIKPHGQFLVVPNEMHPPTQTQVWWFLLPPHGKPWLVCGVSVPFLVLVSEHIPCHRCMDKWVTVVCISRLRPTI